MAVREWLCDGTVPKYEGEARKASTSASNEYGAGLGHPARWRPGVEMRRLWIGPSEGLPGLIRDAFPAPALRAALA